MAESKIVSPTGKPYLRVPVVEIHGLKLPVRELNQKNIEHMPKEKADPRLLVLGVLTQTGDQNNLLWAGFLALAKDVYGRDLDKKSTRHFQDFADQVGLRLSDGETTIDVAAELAKI